MARDRIHFSHSHCRDFLNIDADMNSLGIYIPFFIPFLYSVKDASHVFMFNLAVMHYL
jgi:hypothetical protein